MPAEVEIVDFRPDADNRGDEGQDQVRQQQRVQLQLMQGRASAERRDLEISEISRSRKALAKELNLPVLALSQRNRSFQETIRPFPPH